MKISQLLILLYLLLFSYISQGQTWGSLQKEYFELLKKDKKDSAVIKAKELYNWVRINEKDSTIHYPVSLKFIASAYFEINVDSSLVYYDKSLKIFKDQNRLNHIQVSMIHYNKAKIYYNKNNSDLSLIEDEKAINILEKLNYPQYPYCIEPLEFAAWLCNEKKDHENAQKYYKKLTSLIAENEGKENEEFVKFKYLQANEVWELKNYEEGTKLYNEALEVEKKILGEDNVEYLKNLKIIADLLKKSKIQKEAIKLYCELIIIQKDQPTKDLKNYLETLYNLSEIYVANEDYINAEIYYKEVIKVKKELSIIDSFTYTNELYAKDLIYLGNIYTRIHMHLDAEKYFEQANEIIKTLHNNNEVIIRYYQCKGFLDYDKGNFSLALEYYFKALDLIKKSNITNEDKKIYSNCLNDIAGCYNEMGDFNSSEKYFKIAIEYIKVNQGISSKNYSTTLNNLGEVCENQQKYALAEKYFTESLNIKKDIFGINHWEYLNSLNSLADLFHKINDFKKSESLYKQALAIIELMPEKENRGYANCLNGLGMNYYNQEEFKSAELYCRKATEISKKYLGVSNIYYAGYLVNLGSVLSEINNYSEAFKCYNEALEIYKIKGSDQLDHYAAVLNNIGLLEGQNKNYVNTENFFNEALKIYKDKYGENNYSYAHQLFNLSDLYILTNDPRSLQYFIDAYNIEKKYFYKNSYNLTESQNEFYKKDLYSKTIKFQNLINYKSVENSNLISSIYSNWINLNGFTYNQSTRLKNEILSSKDDVLINNYNEYKLIKSQLMNYNNTSNLNELESKSDLLEKEIILKTHEFKEFKEYSFDDLQSKILPEEAFVDIIRVPNYNFNNDGEWGESKEGITYVAYITTSETKLKPEIVKLGNGSELENEIIKLYKEDTFGKKRKEINKSGFYYDNYWKPIESKLINKKKILISFSGVYNELNIQTLYNPITSRFLADEKDLYFVNNPLSFIKKREGKVIKYSNLTATLIGYPNYDGELSTLNDDLDITNFKIDKRLTRGGYKALPLPGTKIEVENIDKILKKNNWQVNLYISNEATENIIKEEKSPRVLHIATHGYFLSDQDIEKNNKIMGMDKNILMDNSLLRSGLLFTGANHTLKGEKKPNTADGILTAYEASFLDLQNTELVVLSACKTGTGEIKNGEGIYGLRKAIKDAGAENVIMSLWDINDEITLEFMTLFYQNWQSGINIHDAFNTTQQTIKSKYPQPYYWAGFVLLE